MKGPTVAKSHLERRYTLLEKLAELTPKMRHAQRQYSKTRNKADMFEAVDLESKVDRVIDELDVNRGYLRAELPGQASLFD